MKERTGLSSLFFFVSPFFRSFPFPLFPSFLLSFLSKTFGGLSKKM